MKLRSVSILVAILAVVVVFLLAARQSEQRQLEVTARAEAFRFITAMNAGDEGAASIYLGSPRMDPADLESALMAHARNLQTTDFQTAPVTLEREKGGHVATFLCNGGAELAMFSDRDGGSWRVAAIESR